MFQYGKFIFLCNDQERTDTVEPCCKIASFSINELINLVGKVVRCDILKFNNTNSDTNLR